MNEQEKEEEEEEEEEICPKCRVSFRGGLIADSVGEKVAKENYGGQKYWSRKIGIEDPEVYDGISWWKCPDCEYVWNRFPWSPEYKENKK